VDLPFFEMVIVHGYVNVYQRVSILSMDWIKVKLEPESPIWENPDGFPVQIFP
jgi:hypothetical protein